MDVANRCARRGTGGLFGLIPAPGLSLVRVGLLDDVLAPQRAAAYQQGPCTFIGCSTPRLELFRSELRWDPCFQARENRRWPARPRLPEPRRSSRGSFEPLSTPLELNAISAWHGSTRSTRSSYPLAAQPTLLKHILSACISNLGRSRTRVAHSSRLLRLPA